MIYRAEAAALMIFNPDSGITAMLSGQELTLLTEYLCTELRNEFINRLEELQLLPVEIDKAKILATIAVIPQVKKIFNSFTVPEAIHLDLTTSCPLACPQCYKAGHSEMIMPLEKFKAIIRQAQAAKVFQIALGGGEPLLVPNLVKYVETVTTAGMACTLTSSGFGLTEELLQALRDAKLHHLQISLNGATEAINSTSRAGFKEALSALELLSKQQLKFGINWVARMDNYFDFPKMVALAQHFHAENINLLRYKPVVQEEYQKFALTQEAFTWLQAQLKQFYGIKLKVDSAFSNLLCSLYQSGTNSIAAGCGAGRRFMVIDAAGRFKPCSHLKATTVAANLVEYWQNSTELKQLRKLENFIGEPCGSCSYLHSCRGCRAICAQQNIYAGETNCPAYAPREVS